MCQIENFREPRDVRRSIFHAQRGKDNHCLSFSVPMILQVPLEMTSSMTSLTTGCEPRSPLDTGLKIL